MAMTFNDYRNQYGPGANMHNNLNSWYQLSNAGFKKQYKSDMQEKNKALMQAQKAYQEATPENKQAAQANLQNAQKAAQDAESLYTKSLTNTEKDLYNIGKAGKAAGKAFVSGIKQQLPVNKNSQNTDNNTISTQAKDTTGHSGNTQGQEQTAEQKGTSFGQKAAQATGTVAQVVGKAIGNKWQMQQAGKDPTGTSEANRQIANNHQNMQMATSQAFADRAKQDASRPLGSITGENTSHLTKIKAGEDAKQAAADGGAAYIMQDHTVMSNIDADRNFKTQREQTAHDRQQEANDEQNVADVLRQDAAAADYNAMQMADYNNQSNNLSNAIGGQQEAVAQQTAQNPSDAKTADEESTGAKDFSFQIPGNEVQGVINAVLGNRNGADIRNGGGTPAQQQYYKYLINNGVEVPQAEVDVSTFKKMGNGVNEKAMDAMLNMRSGGDPTKNYVQGKDGKYYAEGSGEKMNETQYDINSALTGKNAAFR